MPPKKKNTSNGPLNERETRVVVAALRAMTVKPTVNFDAMAKEMGYINTTSAKNALFKTMKKLGNDPTKLPKIAPRKKSSSLKRGADQVEESAVETMKEPHKKRKNTMTLHKSLFDLDSEQDEGGVLLEDEALSHAVPSIEKDPVPNIRRGSVEYVAEFGRLPGASDEPRTIRTIFDDYPDLGVQLSGPRIRFTGPRMPSPPQYLTAQEELAALLAEDHGGKSDTDEDNCSSSIDYDESASSSDDDDDDDGDYFHNISGAPRAYTV